MTIEWCCLLNNLFLVIEDTIRWDFILDLCCSGVALSFLYRYRLDVEAGAFCMTFGVDSVDLVYYRSALTSGPAERRQPCCIPGDHRVIDGREVRTDGCLDLGLWRRAGARGRHRRGRGGRQ